ncbi:MAG: hypothetical protein AAGF12_41920 [Myxococcota bacterium]
MSGLLACEGTDIAPIPGSDGGPGDGGIGDAASDAVVQSPDATPDAMVDAAIPIPPPVVLEPKSILFIGNSFTLTGPVPEVVRDLAVHAGFPEPNAEMRALGGRTLEYHRGDDGPSGAPARVREGWDVVVLQEFSTRPTDQVGPAEQFKEDAVWFYDLAKEANLETDVILYETWARRFNHPIYNRTFESPMQMQDELHFHYFDAAERYIPMFSMSARPNDARVAPVGDAWALQLSGGEPPRLHSRDDYHPGPSGVYLNALVLYSTIYRRAAQGLAPVRVTEEIARVLQVAADATTGETALGPELGPFVPLPEGEVVRVDFGPDWIDGWQALPEEQATIGPLATVQGTPTHVRVTSWGFAGTQTGGADDNDLGYPPEVSRDTLWVGSFDGHAAALEVGAQVLLRGLAEGTYEIRFFASRDGTDNGRGRLARYSSGDARAELDAANNQSNVATLEVAPDEHGQVVLDVRVSPEGEARFAYIGALEIRTLAN